jgi:hypothetical protein
MNCNTFFLWMKTNVSHGVQENLDALSHMQSCPACRQMYDLDACLESCIQQAFTPHRLPAGLVERIDDCVNRYEGAGRHIDPPGHTSLQSVNTADASDAKKIPDTPGPEKIQPENDRGH